MSLARNSLTQIYRFFLLAEMYGFEGLQSYYIILAPKDHPSTEGEYNKLHDEQREEYQHKIRPINLEDFVNNIISVCPEEYKDVFKRFYDRYLNFPKLKQYE